MLDLAELIPAELMNPASVYLVIARIRAATLPRATKRYLLGEWARQVGIVLSRERYDELRGGPEL